MYPPLVTAERDRSGRECCDNGSSRGGWPRNAQVLKTQFRMLLGIIWVVDGSLQFAAGFVDAFAGSISGDGQPAWLQDWFTFWSNAVNGNQAF